MGEWVPRFTLSRMTHFSMRGTGRWWMERQTGVRVVVGVLEDTLLIIMASL